MPQLTDPFSHRTATRPLDLYPAPQNDSPDTRRQRRLVSVVVALGCVVTLAVAVLLGTSGPSRQGTGLTGGVPEAAGPAPAEAAVGPATVGPTGGSSPAPAAADGTAPPAPQDQSGTDGAATAEPTPPAGPSDPPGQHWATVRIVEPSRLTFPAGEPANLWATATLEDGTAVANAKLRWRIWSEPEHALVHSHQGWHAVTPALPAGRYTVVVSVVDATVSGGLKRTLVFEKEGVLLPPTPAPPAPTPLFTGPDAIMPATPDGP